MERIVARLGTLGSLLPVHPALGLGLAVVLLGTAAGTTAAAQDVDRAVDEAIRSSEAGRCEEARERLIGIEGLESRAHLLAGQCFVAQSLFPEALTELDRARGARDLGPEKLGEVELYRGVALFHLERYTEAEAALDAADGLVDDEAQLSLYRGLIALRRGDPERAAPQLESAARLSPAGTEPVASYYAGLAWQGAAERAKARAAFQRVVDLDPDGPWGREAARLLESTRLFPAYAELSAGVEYDDNVRLRGAGIDIPPDDGGKKDWRGVWRVDAGVELFGVDDWTGGLFGAYSGSAHHDLGEFDTHYPSVGLWLDRRLGAQTHARAHYQFGYAWVDDDEFLRTHLVQVGLEHVWDRAGTTEVFADLSFNDFLFENQDAIDATGGGTICNAPGLQGCGPAGVNEAAERNRDGYGVGGAVEHRLLVPLPDALDRAVRDLVVRGQYRLLYYDSAGSEWEHVSNRIEAGFVLGLPLDMRLESWAAYERRDFFSPSTFPDVETPGEPFVDSLEDDDRDENVAEVEVELEKGLSDHLSVTARWSYVDNESSRKVYDYNRHIVGAYLNYRFD